MDKQRILIKLGELSKFISELEEIYPENEEEYLHSNICRRAVERVLQIIIECILDICAVLVKEFSLGPPNDEDNLLDLLKNKLSMIEKIKDMKRFRNILVHRYTIIDNSRVFHETNENIQDFADFIEEVKKLIPREN